MWLAEVAVVDKLLASYALLTAAEQRTLQVLAVLVASGKPASDVCDKFEALPQILKNVRYSGGSPLEAASVIAAIADAEKRLKSNGRLLIRNSGTEPLIRVMAEGEDPVLVEAIVDGVCAAIAEQV